VAQAKNSVVTPERFSQGLTYEQYVGSIERNQKRFQENYDGTTVAPEDIAAMKGLMAKPGGPAKLMVVGEDWCPDVFRGMPVYAKLAEATGLELRIFKRDDNKDIIAEFLNGGEFESIPVAVFYSSDMRELAHFIERPKLANDEMRTLLVPMYQRLRKPDQTDAEKEAAKQEYIAFQNGPVWSNWRHETIREAIRAIRVALA
jgi:thiol-disulfide isomerase/thioredoxin